jgi:hypothetical protein
MKNNVLIKESRYEGKFVAMASFKDRKVLASGNVAEKVFERARKKGFSSPVIFYVPKQTETNIF